MSKINIPTKLTILRILLVPVFVAVYLMNFKYSGIIAVVVFMIASFTDFLDGHLARKWNQVTSIGKFLDPIADKMLVMCALVCVLIGFSFGKVFSILTAVFLMIIESRELMVSCFRIIAASKGVTLAADKWGKAKTVCQMIALIILIPVSSFSDFIDMQYVSIIYYIGFALLALSTVLTIISGLNYVIKNRSVLHDGN